MNKAGLSTQSAISYQTSVHGRAVAQGSKKAAVCTDCHDHHAVRPANDALSGIFKFNVARTCGKCHVAIASQYVESVHGKALARGNWNAPVCTDCHGIHTISRAADQVQGPRSSCVRCHEGVRLSQEFGVAGARVGTYQSSYHGLARRNGSTLAADCASCHGAHEILPSSDPRSAIHPKNLQKTCGKCHQGAQANFANGKVHRSDGDVSDTPSRIVTWIRRIYIVLIIATVGFMVLHNILIWWKKAVAARKERDAGHTVERMNLNQRVQHAVMGISFVVLVISGFALAWPSSWFGLLFGPGEQMRRMVHRIAAVVMMAIGAYHLGYMVFTREGRKAILLISSGIDTFSKLTYDKTRKSLQESGIPVYSIGILQLARQIAEAQGANTSDFLQGDNELRTFAKETGGQAFFPRFLADMPNAFFAIHQALRNQYSLGYSPTNQARDGKFRKITVQLVNPTTNEPLKVTDEKGKPIKYQIIAKAGYKAPLPVE
jgi:hypothetical protein